MKQFNEIYNEYYKLVYRLAVRFLHDHICAADISQEVFMYLYKKQAHNDKIENIKGWLYKVTRNLCLAEIKKNKRIIELNDRIINETVGEIQTNSKIIKALNKLGENDRMLLTLYNEGLSYKELSVATGIKFTSVGKTLSRALKKLKDEVEK